METVTAAPHVYPGWELVEQGLEIARREKATNLTSDEKMILACALLALYQQCKGKVA